MSYMVEVHVACDADGCDEVIHFQRINDGGLNKSWAGYLAKKQGWWVRGRDPKAARCPRHNDRGGAE